MKIRKGFIRGFRGSYGSGLGFLSIEDSITGETQSVPAENGQTVRSLENAFGNVITPGHSVDPKGGHIDQEIYWRLDDMGLCLDGFTPVDEATEEIEEAYLEGIA